MINNEKTSTENRYEFAIDDDMSSLFYLAGRKYKDIGNFEIARKFLTKAAICAKKCDNKNLLAAAWFHMGEMAYLDNDKCDAVMFFKKCLFFLPYHKKAADYVALLKNDDLLIDDKFYIALGERNSSFKRKGWKTVNLLDSDYICDLRKERLPFDDSSIDGVYASHVIEHISEKDSLALFQNVCRCLRTGGVFRVVLPDMDLIIDKYLKQDQRFFIYPECPYILEQIKKGVMPFEMLEMHNRLIGWFASYSARVDIGGSPMASKKVVDKKLKDLSRYEFKNWCVSLLDKNRVCGHVNGYNYDLLSEALKSAGFSKTYRLAYGESRIKAMQNPCIDREMHKDYSLYIEAVK